MAIVFELNRKDYARLIEDEDAVWSVFNFFNIKLNVKNSIIRTSEKLFFVVNGVTDEGKVSGTVSYYSELPFHLNLCEKRSLIEEENLSEGGSEMFGNYKIASVELDDVNDVALEVAIDKIKSTLPGVTFKKKKDVVHMVKDGSVVELKGDSFKTLIGEYMSGKTVSELQSNAAMYAIITSLGLVKNITLEKPDNELKAIFG